MELLLVDTLTNRVLPQEIEFESEYRNPTNPAACLETVNHYSRKLATHCREAFWFLKAALCFGRYFLRSSAIVFAYRIRFHFWVRQSQEQTSHSATCSWSKRSLFFCRRRRWWRRIWREPLRGRMVCSFHLASFDRVNAVKRDVCLRGLSRGLRPRCWNERLQRSVLRARLLW